MTEQSRTIAPNRQPLPDRSYKGIGNQYIRETGAARYHDIVTSENPYAPAFSIEDANAFISFSNCYDYAVNDLDYVGAPSSPREHLPDRHKRSGDQHAFEEFVEGVRSGLQIDGVQFVDPAHLKYFSVLNQHAAAKSYLVAAYARPCDPTQPADNRNLFDFHFVRQDADGQWSHKRGIKGEFTRNDVGGIPITDPIHADMGIYQFIGFYSVPENGLDVGKGPRYNMGGVQLTPEKRRALDRQFVPATQNADPLLTIVSKKFSYTPADPGDAQQPSSSATTIINKNHILTER